MVEDIGALRLKVLKETWEQRLDKQPDGSWRGPAVRVIQEAELISVDIDSIMCQRVSITGWTTDDVYRHLSEGS